MTRIGLIQMRCEKAAIEQNQSIISAYIAEAAALGVDILAFPEMSLTGYADPTRFPGAIVALDGPVVASFVESTRGFKGTAAAGVIERNPAGKPFITQVFARDGLLLGHYRKNTIDDEESPWFAHGVGVPVFDQDGLAWSPAICADIDNPAVFRAGADQGARIVFEMAAPGLYGDMATRNWQEGYAWWSGECKTTLAGYAREMGIWIAVATQAGRTVDEDFPGGGFLFDPQGNCRFETEDWRECAVYLEIQPETGAVRVLAVSRHAD